MAPYKNIPARLLQQLIRFDVWNSFQPYKPYFKSNFVSFTKVRVVNQLFLECLLLHIDVQIPLFFDHPEENFLKKPDFSNDDFET